jgi:hypothetical protein
MRIFGLFFFVLVMASASGQNPAVSHRKSVACEHAVPPEGMHWVCSNQETCNCHLDKDLDDGAKNEPAGEAKALPPLECRHSAPPKGLVLMCDADCHCTVEPQRAVSSGEEHLKKNPCKETH